MANRSAWRSASTGIWRYRRRRSSLGDPKLLATGPLLSVVDPAPELKECFAGCWRIAARGTIVEATPEAGLKAGDGAYGEGIDGDLSPNISRRAGA